MKKNGSVLARPLAPAQFLFAAVKTRETHDAATHARHATHADDTPTSHVYALQ
jgi:hypothetical protein